MRVLFATLAAAGLAMAGVSLFDAHDAKAQGKSVNINPLVGCPAGTCNPKGGPKAKAVSLCSAANCGKKTGQR